MPTPKSSAWPRLRHVLPSSPARSRMATAMRTARAPGSGQGRGSLKKTISRAVGEEDVALRVQVGQDPPRDLGGALHVHVLVDDRHALGEHELPGPPQRVGD